jgi:hypothetical protein
MEKYCLIVDNEDRKDSIETLYREARRKNIKIICKQFNVGSSERDDLLTDERIDLKKVFAAFNDEFRGIVFDLIAFDWDLEDEYIDGIELIRQFKAEGIRNSSPKLLYSGALKEEIAGYCDKFADKTKLINNFDWLWKKLQPLIKIDIIDFVKRDNYERRIVEFLSKKEVNSDILIAKELNNHGALKIKNVYEKYQGLTLSEISQIIENDPQRGVKFLKEFIEMGVAHIVELNDYD